jgi:hypothetical protein
MATGSYEESLPTEGVPDHHEASTFTGRRERWSRRSPDPPTRTNPSKRRAYGQLQLLRRRGRREVKKLATGMSEARSHLRRGRKMPTPIAPGREAIEDGNALDERSAEAVFGRRETSGPPVNFAVP